MLLCNIVIQLLLFLSLLLIEVQRDSVTHDLPCHARLPGSHVLASRRRWRESRFLCSLSVSFFDQMLRWTRQPWRRWRLSFKTESALTWRAVEVLHVMSASFNMTAVQNVDKFILIHFSISHIVSISCSMIWNSMRKLVITFILCCNYVSMCNI